MKVKSESEVAQSCLTLSDPMDGSPPGSSIHGILQARVLEWGAIAFSDATDWVARKQQKLNVSQLWRLESLTPKPSRFGVWRGPTCWSTDSRVLRVGPWWTEMLWGLFYENTSLTHEGSVLRT